MTRRLAITLLIRLGKGIEIVLHLKDYICSRSNMRLLSVAKKLLSSVVEVVNSLTL